MGLLANFTQCVCTHVCPRVIILYACVAHSMRTCDVRVCVWRVEARRDFIPNPYFSLPLTPGRSLSLFLIV